MHGQYVRQAPRSSAWPARSVAAADCMPAAAQRGTRKRSSFARFHRMQLHSSQAGVTTHLPIWRAVSTCAWRRQQQARWHAAGADPCMQGTPAAQLETKHARKLPHWQPAPLQPSAAAHLLRAASPRNHVRGGSIQVDSAGGAKRLRQAPQRVRGRLLFKRDDAREHQPHPRQHLSSGWDMGPQMEGSGEGGTGQGHGSLGLPAGCLEPCRESLPNRQTAQGRQQS